MKILFIGTVEFSRRTLVKLLEMGADIVGVCTKKTSSFNSDFADLSEVCTSVPYVYIDDINSKESIEWIRSKQPDVIFCFGWSSLIGSELLNVAPMGVIGFHPAKLPENRGRHPIIWALALGLKSSASTFFVMREGADDGDIVSQKDFDILYEDTAKTLYDKVTKIALEQLVELLPALETNTYVKTTQDNALANVWRKRGMHDGLIDFRMSSISIFNLVRALSKPYMGAHVEYAGENISVWEVVEVECDRPNIEPGKVLVSTDNEVLVKCSDGAIRILKHGFNELPSAGEYL